MNPVVLFLLLWLGISALVISLPFAYDRIPVWVMRALRIYAFPNAIRIAVSLERDYAEWEFSTYDAKHPRIGTICHYATVGILRVIIGDLRWSPNFIERRIIYDAAKAAVSRRVDAHINRAIP